MISREYCLEIGSLIDVISLGACLKSMCMRVGAGGPILLVIRGEVFLRVQIYPEWDVVADIHVVSAGTWYRGHVRRSCAIVIVYMLHLMSKGSPGQSVCLLQDDLYRRTFARWRCRILFRLPFKQV